MWPNPQETADLVTLTEEIIDGNFIFCAVCEVVFAFFSLKRNPRVACERLQHLGRWAFLLVTSGYGLKDRESYSEPVRHLRWSISWK